MGDTLQVAEHRAGDTEEAHADDRDLQRGDRWLAARRAISHAEADISPMPLPMVAKAQHKADSATQRRRLARSSEQAPEPARLEVR